MKCRETILSDANENWYILLYDLFSRLWYIATCGPFCKDATHIFIAVTYYPFPSHPPPPLKLHHFRIFS